MKVLTILKVLKLSTFTCRSGWGVSATYRSNIWGKKFLKLHFFCKYDYLPQVFVLTIFLLHTHLVWLHICLNICAVQCACKLLTSIQYRTLICHKPNFQSKWGLKKKTTLVELWAWTKPSKTGHLTQQLSSQARSECSLTDEKLVAFCYIITTWGSARCPVWMLRQQPY